MKKIFIILVIISIFCLVGCLDISQYVPIDEYYNKLVELDEANSETESKSLEILGLKEEVNTLENDLELSNEEIEKYNNLIGNLNDLLSNVYYGYAENSNYISEGFNVFSMKYGDKIFLITAGHCIHYNFEGLDTGLYNTIRIRQNKGDWIYLKLLTYENDFVGNRDYAILYSDKIISGLDFDINNSYPEYILGNEDSNIIKQFDIYNLLEGESGSPVINIDGEIMGISTGNFVDIDLIIEAIDNLK